MDTLISIGTTAALLWSIVALFFGTAGQPGMVHPFELTISPSHGLSNIYLEVAAGVITFILLGRYLEVRAKRQSGEALRALLELGAKDAVVLRTGVEQRIPVGQLVPDIGKHRIKDWNTAPLCRWNRYPTRSHQREQPDRLQDHCLAASIGTCDDDLITTRIHIEVHRNHFRLRTLQIKGRATHTLSLSPE